MKTYFLQFKVVPTLDNEQYELVEGALASCWVLDNTPQAAHTKANFRISMFDWEINTLEMEPVEVEEGDFVERDIGLEQFKRAQVDGMAIVYTAWARDKKTLMGPISLKSSYKSNLQGSLDDLKKQRDRGRCLHFDGDHRCREIIKAHSIQKQGLLAVIAQNNHVYTLAAEMSDLRKNAGLPIYKKESIYKVSSFRGFCKFHDNKLFEAIDNNDLMPTDQQVLLYAYRSLARELFVKENAFNHLEYRLEKTEHRFLRQFFLDYKAATEFSLNNLRRHKLLYDNSLKSKSYHDIRYVLFLSNKKPTMAFSGLLYPDFDFMGRALQDLGNHEEQLELITFCSAPMISGWGYLFAWHKTSSNICTDYMRSLATMMYQGYNVSDILFRMVIINCENCAISPEWWESLEEEQREEVAAAGASNTYPYTPMKNTYLSEGVDGISGWHFANIMSNMELGRSD
ncbi:MAG: hypothetical protein D3920_01700 [Candidatus Electrothrix sp. AW2]|nr:hypothetical protein [Candidatus Electrothrix gigas]